MNIVSFVLQNGYNFISIEGIVLMIAIQLIHGNMQMKNPLNASIISNMRK